MTLVHVTRAAPLATIQDAGRFGMLQHGISESGPMDRGAFERAGAALPVAGGEAIEFSRAGLGFAIAGGTVQAAFDGGEFSLTINGIARKWPVTLELRDGDTVDIAPGPSGNYGYVRFDKTIDVPAILGSRATNLVCGLGGHEGRALRAGDELSLVRAENMKICAETMNFRETEGPIRFIWGIHAELFTLGTRNAFLAGRYTVSRRLDRMGVTLDHPARLFTRNPVLSLVSDAIVAGDIQILGDGTPIVLMRDHQPTGGYPRIGTVISADLDRFAQLRPGTELAFAPVTLHKARDLLLASVRS
jgi:biotin-dependent carboxylase-like uncharacterized protein